MDDTEDFVQHYAAQIRAARSSLGWTQRQLAGASGLPQGTIARIELADGRLRKRNLAAVRVALGVAGVMVMPGHEDGARVVDGRGRRGRAVWAEGDHVGGD